MESKIEKILEQFRKEVHSSLTVGDLIALVDGYIDIIEHETVGNIGIQCKIEKIGYFLVPSGTSEGVTDALQSLADKLNEIIDYLNSQAQPEEVDNNNWYCECGEPANQGEHICKDTPEEWEERFNKYWGCMFECGDYEKLIDDIKQLLDEREREVLEEAKKIIDEESIYSGGECGTPLELLEWFVDTGLDKLKTKE